MAKPSKAAKPATPTEPAITSEQIDKPYLWQPGQSGNPSGRPKVVQHIKELARAYTAEAIQALVEALKDPRSKVPAAMALLDRGYGRPEQTHTIRTITRIEDLTDEELASLAANAEREKLTGETRH